MFRCSSSFLAAVPALATEPGPELGPEESPDPESFVRTPRASSGRPWLKICIGLYAVVLLASWARMLTAHHEPAAPRDHFAFTETAALVPAGQTLETADAAPVRLAYWDAGPRTAPVLLALQGSPGSGSDFRDLIPLLEDRFRIIAPDLPGFGQSTREIPDVSVRAHAGYCLALLDELGIERFHAVGFSMGGGVALELIDRAPERVESLTLMASIGVIELELLGSHALNHGIHGLQLGAFRAIRWLIPHFGAFDSAMLGIPYARNFYDTDQRRLRPILEKVDAPTLILHGEDDFLVPLAAAQEHARIVPQAEFIVMESPASHFLPWSAPRRVVAELSSFVDRVEAGAAPRRSAAPEARLTRSVEPFDPSSLPPFEGLALLMILALLAVATFVSEDLACIAAGLLVADGRIGFVAASIACFLGIFIGDLGLYLIGRAFGRPALRRRPLKWFISDDAVERASHWFESKGIRVIFLSRFTPGLRLPTYVAAGVLRTRLIAFAFFFAVAGILWTPALVGIAALAGDRLAEAMGGLGTRQLPLVLLLVVVLFQAYRLLPLCFTHRGRRLLRGKWLRLRRWEFWPPYITYLPLIPYLAWLSIKHRSAFAFAASNPAMPMGGLIGESKAEILEGLGRDHTAVPAFLLLRADDTPETRASAAEDFMTRTMLSFPVILKPNEGQRGSGVALVGTMADLLERAGALDHDAILQARLDGEEFGVFYTRSPGEPSGSIFGITVKVLPEVIGDGKHTMEELLLDDARACALHATYMKELGPRSDEIPNPGAARRLVHVGTHSRGAIFLDGAHLITPELEAAVDGLSRGYEGFYFGRYDLMAPSAEHLARAEGLGVIELNGVTSEATNLYDPKHSMIASYGILFAQWKLAYSIGAKNAALGCRTATVGEILREWFRYRRKQRSHRA
ncbi:MAG: pimeloyl-ACP methyl ester carboxylesterase/membrane protein DedA with SNARE-associated domain [Planctomycetota bacterium]|jgi:pimeloyl-ACP methyl ester carboxylesterase/membrane protein DedA with SNARE-associated domain